MEHVKPASIEDHLKVVSTVRVEVDALGTKEIEEPDIPMKVFLDELRTTLLATIQYFSLLAAVGFTEAMHDAFAKLVWALDSAQTLWNTERRGGRSEVVAAIIESAEDLRQDLLSAADLALRHVSAGLARVAAIREGEGLADLVSDLGDLALLLTDFRAEFEAIKMDVDAESAKAAQACDALTNALAEEDVAKTLSGNKELRDRLFTLTKIALEDVRAYATHAFRRDKTNARRHLFKSAYLRRKRNRASSRKGDQTVVADTAVTQP